MRRVGITLLSIVLWVIGSQVSVHALSSDTKQFISADNTFYAYVKGGETISADFVRVGFDEPFDTVRGDVTIVMDGPGASEQRCVAPGGVPVGQGCHFAPQTATKSGIWRVQFIPPNGAKPYSQAAPNAHWGKNWFTWNVTVKSGAAEQHGRTWTEQYNLRQPADKQYADDLMNYYISEDGYIYKATELGYNGQISTLSADGIGNRTGTSCVSAYESVDVGDTKASPSYGECGSAYKLFFEQPAGDLPTSASRWDDTTDWVRPNISRPSVSNLHFASDNSQDQLSGTISFFLHNFIGQYQIKIDVDNDGSFDGQSDVTLNEQMKKRSDGLQQVHFQGVDKQGQVILPSQTIGVRIDIKKVAEIHLVAADVEGRTGGLELTRLSGDNAPTTGICWNDTELTPLADDLLMTKKLDGRDCPDSTGGVHGWAYADSSWGNARYIDDWVYAAAKLDGSNQITYPDAVAKAATGKSMNWALIAAVAAVAVLIGIGVTVVIIRGRKNKSGGQSPPALPPTNIPPTYPQPGPNDGDPPVPEN